MKRSILIFAVAFFLVSFCQAQPDTLKNITVTKDARIDLLLQKNKEINEENYLKTLKNMDGFRLQLVSTNDRQKALDLKTKMMAEFPEEETYLLYHAPYFRVQMGNFRTREDAGRFAEKLKKTFSGSAIVVPSKVVIKPSKDGELIL